MKDFGQLLKNAMPSDAEFRKMGIEAYIRARNNKTCISYWYDKIKTGLPEINMPETYFIRTSCEDWIDLTDNKPQTSNIHQTVKRLSEFGEILGYPFFLKNSLFSGKHSWKDTCIINSKDDIFDHCLKIMVEHYMCGVCDDPLFFVARRLIKTNPIFYAFSDMPVTTERRYFSKNGTTYFHHPYWPPFSIQNPSIPDWKEKLEADNKYGNDEIQLLSTWSNQISSLIGSGWSIDWLKDADGKWWLTDMAEDYKSFIWKDYMP